MNDFKLVNVVGGGDLGVNIDLYTAYNKLLKFEPTYEPEQAPGLHLKLPISEVTVMVFQSGKYHLTGAQNTNQIQEAGTELADLIESSMELTANPNAPEVRNLVYTGDIGQEINLEALALDLDGAVYDPLTDNGIIYREDELKGTVMIYRTGSYTYTGSNREEEAQKMINNLYSKLGSLLDR